MSLKISLNLFCLKRKEKLITHLFFGYYQQIRFGIVSKFNEIVEYSITSHLVCNYALFFILFFILNFIFFNFKHNFPAKTRDKFFTRFLADSCASECACIESLGKRIHIYKQHTHCTHQTVRVLIFLE